jgi:hypothetical protein
MSDDGSSKCLKGSEASKRELLLYYYLLDGTSFAASSMPEQCLLFCSASFSPPAQNAKATLELVPSLVFSLVVEMRFVPVFPTLLNDFRRRSRCNKY